MELLGTSLLAGGRGSAVGEPLAALDPRDGRALSPAYFAASLAELDEAVQAAEAAAPGWRRAPGSQRAALLEAIAAELEARSGELVARAGAETALPAARLQGELARTTGQLRLFAERAREGSWVAARLDHGDPGRQPLPKPDVRSMLQGLGPVAVFGASNFPLAFSVAGGDTAAALAAGCPVVVKAHHAHLGTSELAGLCIQSAVARLGLPGGLFSLLIGTGAALGQALVRHPGVRAVGFTGSRAAGRALMDAAAARPEPIPVYAEMGSVNPVVLLPRALAARGEAIADGLHASVTLGVGQFCTNPGLVLALAGEATDACLARLAERMAATPPATMLTAGICSAYRAGRQWFGGVAEALAQVDVEETSGQAGAALFAVDGERFLDNPRLAEEVFGPVALVVRCADRDELLAAVRSLPGQLTATLHAEPGELAAWPDLLALLEARAGRLLCNGFPTGVEVCHAMVHGGPYPATSDGRSTSVGTRSIERFARGVCYQNWPDEMLPPELRDDNPLGIARLVDGQRQG